MSESPFPYVSTSVAQDQQSSGRQARAPTALYLNLSEVTMLDLTPVRPSLQKLQAVEAELSSVLIEREEAIRAAIIALLTRQHLALIGVKGAAKSHLFIELARRISPPSGTGLRYFGYLMTKFTTPD